MHNIESTLNVPSYYILRQGKREIIFSETGIVYVFVENAVSGCSHKIG